MPSMALRARCVRLGDLYQARQVRSGILLPALLKDRGPVSRRILRLNENGWASRRQAA
jgi:hypothetical protein